MGMSREAFNGDDLMQGEAAVVAKNQPIEEMSSTEETASRRTVNALIEGCRMDGRLDFQNLTDLLNDEAIVVHGKQIDNNTRRMLIKELQHLLQRVCVDGRADSLAHLRIGLATRNALFRARIYSITDARALLSSNKTVPFIGEVRTKQLREAIERFDAETAAVTVDNQSGEAEFSDFDAGI